MLLFVQGKKKEGTPASDTTEETKMEEEAPEAEDEGGFVVLISCRDGLPAFCQP